MAIWILSKQQRRVLQMVACGFTNEEISKRMALSESAIRSSLNQALLKLNARCRIDAIYTAIRFGEISELHAYAYVEARQMANCLADNKQPDIRLRRQGHDFLVASNNGILVPYSPNDTPFLSR